MQKAVIGILTVLVLALLAFNARLQERERVLEERLAAAERMRTPKATLAPAPAPESAAVVAEVPRPATPPAAPVGPAPAAVVHIEAPMPAAVESKAATERFLQSNLKAMQVELADSYKILNGTAQLVLQDVIQQAEGVLPDGRRPGYLGISGGDAKGGGAEVTGVLPNGVAVGAGLKNGDVILEFNGESVQGLNDLARRIRETGEGAPVSLRIRRDGSEFVQGVQLGRRPQ